MTVKEKKSFEEAIERLQEIVAALESGKEPLEDSMALFEEGAKLSKECYTALSQAEQRITEFTKLTEASENENEEQ